MDVAELLIAAFTLSAMGYYWLKKHGYIRAASKHSVNRSQVGNSEIMSRTPDLEPVEAASDHRQTASQTDQTPAAAPKPQPATLDTCKSLRAHGYTREEARAFLRGMDRTLDNNVWAAAQPPAVDPDDELVTPFAGRVTKRSYYTDVDFPYEEPKV